MSTGGACGCRSLVRTFRAKAHRDVSRREVHNGCRNEEGGYLARTAFHQVGMLALDNVESAYARSNVNADILSILRSNLQARHVDCFFRCREGKVDEASHFFHFFFFDEV